MKSLTFRCPNELNDQIENLSTSMGLNKSQVIIKLCSEGRISDRSKVHKNQIEILYNANVIRNQLNKISVYISNEKVIDILVLEYLIKIEQYLKEITYGK